MTHLQDEEILLLLLKSPKKKYIKHLVEFCAGLNLCHNSPPDHYTTPLIKTFQQDLELTTEESHRLLLAISELVGIARSISFDFEKHKIFSEEFDSQVKDILINTLLSIQSEIEATASNSLRMGNKLIDFNWKLDLQVASESGKNNIPHIVLEIESEKDGGLEVDKVLMKGEQFMAFFGNLKKIKENLMSLVEKGEAPEEGQ